MAITIQLRRGTAADWTSANSTLAIGETGIETDTRKFKFGDGTTAWNDLDYAVATPTPVAAVRCGSATLASGTVTVDDTEVTELSAVVVTAQSAPLVPGTALYVDPANYVAATSFDISSDDVTDSRAVFWMASEINALPPLALPDLFYVSFSMQFDGTELSDGSEPGIFNCNDTGFTTTNALAFSPASGAADRYNSLSVLAQFSGGSSSDVYDITATPIIADIAYVVDFKFDFAPDHLSLDLTTRLDGVELGTLAIVPDPSVAWYITSFLLGVPADSAVAKRQFDYFKVGTTDYGTDDLFSGDFSSVAPFDSLQGTGISVTGGALAIDIASDTAYALKTCS